MLELISASSPANKARRDYSTPELTTYGKLVDLTATGSGSQSESAGMNVMNCSTGFNAHQACAM